jgi:hypothetical protein
MYKDQYKEKKPKDKTIAEKFNTYHFVKYKEQVVDLLTRGCTVSVETRTIEMRYLAALALVIHPNSDKFKLFKIRVFIGLFSSQNIRDE